MDGTDRGTVVVARTRDPLEAQIWLDLLRNAGIRAAVFEQGVRGALGGATLFGSAHHIVVGRADIADARNIIADADGVHALAPLPQDDEAREKMSRALFAVGAVVAGLIVLLVIVQASA